MQEANWEYLVDQFSYPYKRRKIISADKIKSYYRDFIKPDVLTKYDVTEYELAAAMMISHIFKSFIRYTPHYTGKHHTGEFWAYTLRHDNKIPTYEWFIRSQNREMFDRLIALLKHFGIKFPHVEPEEEFDPNDKYFYHGHYIKTFHDMPRKVNYKELNHIYNMFVEIIREAIESTL